MDSYTIVVSDNEILSRICGTNDSNLKHLESYFGLPVYAKGNELSIFCKEPEVHQQFSFVLNRIMDELSEKMNSVSDIDIIRSVLNNDSSVFNDHAFFSKYSISVPGGVRKIYPQTRGQAVLVKAMREDSLVFAQGPAGSGKTFLAVAESLRLLLSHKVSSIILTRPVVEAGENLGFLPGDLQDKIDPYMRPLYDCMNSVLSRDSAKKLLESGVVEVAPLAYMRGRTLTNCAVILDEAQNTTVEQMKMFLTRMGDNTRMFVTGDKTQIDLSKKIPSGLNNALDVLKNIEGISIVNLTGEDVVRNELVKKIIQAYENEEK